MGRGFRVSEELETVRGSPHLTVQLPIRPSPLGGRRGLWQSHTGTQSHCHLLAAVPALRTLAGGGAS